MGKKFVPNTVKGKRRGSKWPPAVRTACLCEMLIEPNLHLVAKRNGVPESTLRGWWNETMRQSGEERARLWGEAQRAAMTEVAYRAANGAKLSVAMIGQRLVDGNAGAKRAKEIRALLAEDPEREEADALRGELESLPLLHDYPLANFTRVLMSAAGAAHEASGQSANDGGGFSVEIRVVD